MEDFAKEYPKLASQARNITSETDSVYDTSYETYLKGELLKMCIRDRSIVGKSIVRNRQSFNIG